MNTFLNECINELALCQECMNEYEVIDSYLEIFEAENEKVLEQMKKNQNAQAGSESHIKKAINAIINAINNLITKIKGFFTGKKFDAKEKELQAKMAAAKKKDSGIGNKQIKVLDTNAFNKEYESILKEAENADAMLASGKDMVIGPIMDKISKFCSSGAGAVTVSIGMEAALQAASSSKEMANQMVSYLEKDRELEQKLMDAVGQKEYKNFKKDMSALGKRTNLRQMILRLKGYKAKSLEEAINNTFSQCDKIFSGIGNLVGVAINNPNDNRDGHMSGAEYGLKTAKHFLSKDNRKTTMTAAKDIAGNHGAKIAKRILGNEDIKNVAQTGMALAKDNSKFNRENYKASEKAYKKAVKKDAKLQKSKNKSDQSMMDAVRGAYDDNSSIKKGGLVDKAIQLSNRLHV